MTQKLICHILHSESFYEIEIGANLIYNQVEYLKSLASKFAIITDDQVALLYATKFKEHLISNGLEAHLFSFPPGEAYKTRATKEFLEDQLFEKEFSKDSCVIAIGGGVVTDLAGYIAATYCRGVPLIMIPTSLLAMVDASIGGKTAVNVVYGKNMLGVIYQPQKVIIDLTTLQSLSKAEISNGFVEVIKHALIVDKELFEILEHHAEKLLALDLTLLQKVIFRSCHIKNKIVEQDEKEKGMRHLLNFGHTVAHALEHLTDYSLSHGQAVAIGLVVESYLCVKLGLLDQSSLDRIKNVLIRYGLDLKLPHSLAVSAIYDAMTLDKKSRRGQAYFVRINGIGSAVVDDGCYCAPIEETLIKNALQWMNDDLCCNCRANI